MNNSMRFYAELYVEQSPATVWSYFSDLTQWSRWSPICLECRLAEGVRLGTGSVMRIRFRVARITTVVQANVVSMRSPHVITWTGAKYGLNAVHTYRFESHGSGTLIDQRGAHLRSWRKSIHAKAQRKTQRKPFPIRLPACDKCRNPTLLPAL